MVTLTFRQRFEAWATETFSGPNVLERDSGSYRDERVHGAWVAWQYWAIVGDGDG